MSVWIQHIETLVPEYTYSQNHAAAKMQEWIPDPRMQRMIRVLYRKSGIDRRYSVISGFDEGLPGDFFPRDGHGNRREPTTGERNALYTEHAHPLAVRLAEQAIDACPGVGSSDLTHLITVSCTGFSNPGLDYHIVHELGLSSTTQRYHLGFMGCYAALPALRMARQFCAADPDAVVMVLCLELCTLHLQLNTREDSMLANSLFSDGAAAAIVSSRQPQQSAYRLNSFHSALIPDGQQEMAWTIGDTGFDIALSSYVPRIIGQHIRSAVAAALPGDSHNPLLPEGWAVHPGGKAILDKVAESLNLDSGRLEASHRVLRNYGNMSSATILFVLREMLRDPSAPPRDNTFAMAFGPGLTVEMGRLEAIREPHSGSSAIPRTAAVASPV